MKRVAKTSVFIEKVHKGFVYTCIAVTLYGCSVIALRGYRYYTEVRPQIEQRKLLEQKALLAEGSADTLKDPAANLKP